MPNPPAARTRALAALLTALASSPAGVAAAPRPGAPATDPAGLAADAPEPGSPGSFQVRIAEPATALAVRRALAGAYGRLGDERCAAVVDEFQDGTGTPLRARLAAIAPTPQAALLNLFFYDGSSSTPCRRRQAWAWTAPGSRAILVCAGVGFLDRAVRHPRRPQLWMIHELLHSLGLEENPPSSEEITRRVARLCRDSG